MIQLRNEVSPVQLHESGDPARLAQLRPEWTELHQAAAPWNPFLSWEWQYTWWRHFARRRPLWIIEAREPDGGLAGLVVLAARPSLGGVRRFALLTNGATGTDAVDLLVRPGHGVRVRAAVAQALARALPRWDAIDLEDLPCGTPTVPALRAVLAGHGVRAVVEPRYACPGFALRGTFEEHVARLRRRATYLRRRRWLERRPGFEVEVAARPEEARDALADFLRLHHLRWAAAGGSSGIPRGALEDFHRDVAPLLAARGWLRLYRLRVEGRTLAAVYGLELGGRFHYYQSGMDPAWASHSPGLVLLGRTVQDAYARGLTDYDFLRGSEPHKLDWAGDRRETCALRLRAPGLRAEAGAAAEEVFRRARDAARSVAPQRVWEVLRRARREAALHALTRAGPDAAPGEGAGEENA